MVRNLSSLLGTLRRLCRIAPALAASIGIVSLLVAPPPLLGAGGWSGAEVSELRKAGAVDPSGAVHAPIPKNALRLPVDDTGPLVASLPESSVTFAAFGRPVGAAAPLRVLVCRDRSYLRPAPTGPPNEDVCGT